MSDRLLGFSHTAARALPLPMERPGLLDALIRPLIDPSLDRLGRRLAAWGLSANGVTMLGLAAGLAAAAAVALSHFWTALGLVLVSRILDGLDGAVARATSKTDFGGYFDILCDFCFYAAIPLAFVVHDPGANAVAGAFLLAAFYVNGASFLGFALLAEKRLLSTRVRGSKSLYYSGGLLEGTETILFFLLLCLLPSQFPWLAAGFAALTLLTSAARTVRAWRLFGRSAPPS